MMNTILLSTSHPEVMTPENEATSVLLIVAIVVLAMVNIAMLILEIHRKRAAKSEVSMDVDDYLTLILEQLDQVAKDAIKIASLNRKDFDTEDEYYLAIFAVAKERLFECGAEYGLSTNVLKLIDSMKLDSYIIDAIKVCTRKSEFIEDTKDIGTSESMTESFDENDETSETVSDNEAGVTDIGKELASIYDDE